MIDTKNFIPEESSVLSVRSFKWIEPKNKLIKDKGRMKRTQTESPTHIRGEGAFDIIVQQEVPPKLSCQKELSAPIVRINLKSLWKVSGQNTPDSKKFTPKNIDVESSKIIQQLQVKKSNFSDHARIEQIKSDEYEIEDYENNGIQSNSNIDYTSQGYDSWDPFESTKSIKIINF